MLKIIDFHKKGNVVRFYLGEEDLTDYWGDDWNDRPYDCNAGTIYDQYVSGHVDIAFPFDYMVLEPCDTFADYCNCSKEDMMNRNTPCIIVVPPKMLGNSWDDDNYSHWVGSDKVIRFYFEDKLNVPSGEIILWTEGMEETIK